MGKETKIPALTGAELKKIEEIETSVGVAIKGLREAVSALDGLLHKNTTSKDLKEFYKWARICDLEMEGLIADEGHSLIDDVEYAFEGIFADMKEREKFQKVYREGFVDLGYDYVDREDLETDGFFKCPVCGTWLFGEDEFCPICGRESNVIPFPNAPFNPFKSESGLTIDPMLLSFEEIADIFERKKNQIPVEEDDEDDGWDDLSDGVWNETDSDDWCDCAGCPCCECMGFGTEIFDEEGYSAGIEEQVSRAYDEATEALDYLYAAIAQMEIGPHINCLKSDPIQDFRKSVYLGWVFNSFFADKHSPYNLRGLWEKMQIALEELKPHLNNTEEMVMAKVYVQDDDGEVIEEFSRTKYIPLEEAQETARICPNCGLWVDNEIDVCDCGEWLEPVVTTSNAPEKIKLSLEVPDGFTVEALSKAMGGSGGDFYEEVGDDTIHLMTWNGTGHLGCSTAFRVTELSEWVGDDYVFVSLEKEDDSLVWVLKTDYIAKAFSESPAVVKKTFKLLYDSVAACLGEDYADDLIMTMDLEGEDPGLSAAIAPIITAIFEREADCEDEDVGVCSQEDFNDYVEWLIENEGKQAAFEYCAKVYQKNMAIVGDWVQKLGEELVSGQESKD